MTIKMFLSYTTVNNKQADKNQKIVLRQKYSTFFYDDNKTSKEISKSDREPDPSY